MFSLLRGQILDDPHSLVQVFFKNRIKKKGMCYITPVSKARKHLLKIGKIMNSSLYPRDLWTGDIYIVSAQTYEAYPRPAAEDPLMATVVATYRFDGIPGSHALQPFRGTPLHSALGVTGRLCQQSRLACGHLVFDVIEQVRHIYTAENSPNTGGFDDVIMALSTDTLVNHDTPGMKQLLRRIEEQRDAYEQDLYTTIYEQLKCYGQWGDADMDTTIQDEVDPANAMVCIFPDAIGKRATWFWTSLLMHYNQLNHMTGGESRLHIDPSIKQCGNFDTVSPFSLPMQFSKEAVA